MGLCLGVDLTLHGEWKSWCPQMAILPMSLIICRAPVIGKEQVGLNLGDIDISDYNTDSLCSSKSYIEILTPGTCDNPRPSAYLKPVFRTSHAGGRHAADQCTVSLASRRNGFGSLTSCAFR